jgi:predicted RNase H-related nuclease YkuK (DUF458 family)
MLPTLPSAKEFHSSVDVTFVEKNKELCEDIRNKLNEAKVKGHYCVVYHLGNNSRLSTANEWVNSVIEWIEGFGYTTKLYNNSIVISACQYSNLIVKVNL